MAIARERTRWTEPQRRRGGPEIGRGSSFEPTGIAVYNNRGPTFCTPLTLIKITAIVLLALGLYQYVFLIGTQSEGDASANEKRRYPRDRVSMHETPRATRTNGDATQGRKSFRHLNMIGFDKEEVRNEHWKTCRVYKEAELARHKINEKQPGYDRELKPIPPSATREWELAITRDLDAEWLGLHQWDDRYKYGTAEADRRVEELGYCRVHMPSIPRTGSTWFRTMFEAVTSQPTFSMWPEGGTMKKKYVAFSSDDPCGASADNMEGNMRSKRVSPCRDLRPPNGSSPIMYKSHTPFFPSYNKPSLLPDQTCMVVLIVRNPIDSHDAWMRYMAGKGMILRDFLPVWSGHLTHWIAAAGDVPIYVFRYEDMLADAGTTLRRVMEALPPGWRWSEESIAKALRLFSPKKPFEEKCGAAIHQSSLAEVEMVRKHYSGILRHFGYRFSQRNQ